MKKNNKGGNSLKKIKEEANKYKNSYLRALADYQNFEKRVLEEKEDVVRNASKRLIIKFLPILDNIEKAQIFVKDEGLNMIKQSFYEVLKSEGVEEINVKGQKFNPELAEAVSIIEGKEDGKITEVIRSGYKLNGKVIRPAQVKVEKSSQTDETTT